MTKLAHDTVQFRAKALGTPTPNILWQKDNEPIFITQVELKGQINIFFRIKPLLDLYAYVIMYDIPIFLTSMKLRRVMAGSRIIHTPFT